MLRATVTYPSVTEGSLSSVTLFLYTLDLTARRELARKHSYLTSILPLSTAHNIKVKNENKLFFRLYFVVVITVGKVGKLAR